MEFQILGPVGLRLNGQWLTLGSDKERMLLAALALDVGRPVAISELMERLWDGDPPARSRKRAHLCLAHPPTTAGRRYGAGSTHHRR